MIILLFLADDIYLLQLCKHAF